MMLNENDEIEQKVFTNFINLFLPIELQINELDDLQKDDRFPILIESLLDEKINGWKKIPEKWKGKKMFMQMELELINNNYKIVLDHLSQKNLYFKNKTQPESTKGLIALLWDIFSKFYIVHPNKSLSKILSQKLSEFEPIIQIKNMGSSMSKGIPFIALLSKLSNGKVEYCDDGDSDFNYNYIKQSCQKLKIPYILTPECISTKPNENCNCIQTVLILKYMNDYDTNNVEQKSKKDDAPEKFEEKILQYKAISNDTIEEIENAQKNIEQISICYSKENINYKRKFFTHIFNNTEKKKIQSLFEKVINTWKTLERISNQISREIPSDLIKINYIRQKIDQLDKTLSIQKSNLDDDEKNVNKMFNEIKKINSICKAREKYAEIENKYNIDNWMDF